MSSRVKRWAGVRAAFLIAVVAVMALLAAACADPGNDVGGVSTGGSTPAASTTHSQQPAGSKPAKQRRRRHPAGVPVADMPRPGLTPGVALDVGLGRICTPGYSASVRDVPESEKTAVYHRYDVAHVPYAHEVDHLVSLELGGSNAIANLWPEPYAGRWGARTKDVLENTLHELVCSHRLSLAAAQHQEATNWVAAYRRYVGTPPGVGGSGGGSGSGSSTSSAGGYYASSYPTASTIYCADDSGWRELSAKYLVHFATLSAARARFPGYHLHQPC